MEKCFSWNQDFKSPPLFAGTVIAKKIRGQICCDSGSYKEHGNRKVCATLSKQMQCQCSYSNRFSWFPGHMWFRGLENIFLYDETLEMI